MIEFSELDKVTIMLQAKAYALGHHHCVDGVPHEDRGRWYNQGFSDAYAEQQAISHQTENQ